MNNELIKMKIERLELENINLKKEIIKDEGQIHIIEKKVHALKERGEKIQGLTNEFLASGINNRLFNSLFENSEKIVRQKENMDNIQKLLNCKVTILDEIEDKKRVINNNEFEISELQKEMLLD